MKLLLAIICIIQISACTSNNVIQYKNNQPELDLYSYLQGQTKGWGIVQDRKGNLIRQFAVMIKGRINSAKDLVLEENFDWNDGEKSSRSWKIYLDDWMYLQTDNFS